MLSAREIADYVRGQATTPEKQQFTFSEVKKIENSLTMRRPASAEIIYDEPRPAGKSAVAAKVKRVTAVVSTLRIRTTAKIHSARRNILLVVLFVIIFALMFVLESRQAPANGSQDYARSASGAATI